ncbi:MAG TPA: NADH-quinone oxidoreductase subunit J [Anaerolineales bacterium]
MSVDMILFLILAAVSVGSGLGMLFSRNAIYSALFLVMNFVTVAIFYLLLGAPFIAISQITVYAGAIMVLFLFVIMLLGTDRLSPSQALPWQKWLAIALAFILTVEGVYLLVWRAPVTAGIIPPGNEINAVQALRELGSALFNSFLLPFEVTSILLLVAMVGAIVLSKPDRGGRK